LLPRLAEYGLVLANLAGSRVCDRSERVRREVDQVAEEDERRYLRDRREGPYVRLVCVQMPGDLSLCEVAKLSVGAIGDPESVHGRRVGLDRLTEVGVRRDAVG